MKARSRREIIEENRALRKSVSAIAEDFHTAYEKANDLQNQVKAKNKEIENMKARLRRAGLSGRYEYAGRMARGTVETFDTVNPVNLCGCVSVPANLEAMRNIIAGQLAKALVENGLVMIENAGIDDLTGMQKVCARVSVVPWESMARKCTFEKPGAWKYEE